MTAGPTQERPRSSVELINMIRGIIPDAETAKSFGELLLERHYGQAELARQRPLIVQDKGDYWRVEGSWNRDGKVEWVGAFFLSVSKSDARVTDLGIHAIVHPHPSVRGIIEEHLRAKQNKTKGEP